jgi:glutathione S-transferase
MMKLHWSPRSPFVRKVMIVLHETAQADAVALVRTPVAMAEPNLTLVPDNPLIKLPTLVLDDGYSLFDSRVICEYLAWRAAERGLALFPADPQQRVRVLRQQALGDGFMDALLLFRQERNKTEEKQTPAWLSAFALKTEATLNFLQENAGDIEQGGFDMGAITIGCALSYLDYRFADLNWRERAPDLARWHADVFVCRPSVVATEPAESP